MASSDDIGSLYPLISIEMASSGVISEPSNFRTCCICRKNPSRLEKCQALTRRYETLATSAVPSHRLSRFTRYPKDTSNWPGWNKTIGGDDSWCPLPFCEPPLSSFNGCK